MSKTRSKITIKPAAVPILMIALLSGGVHAGTVLAQPESAFEEGDNGEVFPESRFGAPPGRVETGVSPGYAPSEDRGHGAPTAGMKPLSDAGRAPAGLVLSDTTSISRQPNPRLQADGGSVAQAPAPVDPAQLDLVSEISRKGVQEVSIIANDLGFFPKTIFVSRDVPVRIFVTGASKNTLCIMMDSFQVRRQIRSQKIEEIVFTPANPGKYRFYCPVNGMEGSMVVKELVGSANTPTRVVAGAAGAGE